MSSHRLPSYGITLFGLAALLAPRPGAAQLAPTGGHYGARPSDTGFEPGGPNALGGYSTSIPLDLPAARGNLPIPLSVVYGAHGSSAAGVGWDVPLYYVQEELSFGHRRPALLEDAPPQARERLSVVLPDRGSIPMTLKSTGVWIGRGAGADLKMLLQSDGSWTVSDGAGRTFTFRTQVAKSGLFLLDTVTGAGGGAVHLNYQVSPATSSPDSAASVDLKAVLYDPHPTMTDCYKYEVDLGYDAAPPTFKVVGETVLVRADKLVNIELVARAACGSTASAISLRHYGLRYQTDPDTGLFQLQSVNLYGRQGSAEYSTPIPIATYKYGTATSLNNNPQVLFYQTTPPVTLPIQSTAIGGALAVPPIVLGLPSSNNVSVTFQSLMDMTGDGRADFIYSSNNQISIARNVPGPNGTSLLGPATPLFNGPLTKGFLEERGSKYARFNAPQTTGSSNVDYVWRQAIDFNGDGRIDIVDAAEKPGHWTVYLNTPDSTNQGITWVRRSVRVDTLYKHMNDDRHLGLVDGYVPLSRRFTATSYEELVCWMKDLNGNLTSTTTFPNACGDQQVTQRLPESTVVEWELKDINGDGYPDLLMNSSPTRLVKSPDPDGTLIKPGQHSLETRLWGAAPIGDPNGSPNRVDVALNVRGIFLSNDPTDFNPFAAPATFLRSASCGVSKWSDTFGTKFDVQTVACDITDVNGDGIADRVETVATYNADSSLAYTDAVVSLGTGSGFLPVQMKLPDHLPLSSQRSTQPEACTAPGHTGSTKFTSGTTTALRDVTGDGIPDLINFDVNQYGWYVYVGTGGGFGSRIFIQNSAFALSENTESCDGSISYTTSGLYDIDGDGKPEIVTVDGNSLLVAQLDGNVTPGTPEAGRLVDIDNGYGAITGITYRSAKDDPYMLHQVPFAEIVATSVQTISASDGRLLSGARYAYGGAKMMYDQVLDTYRMPAYGRSVELHAVIEGADRLNAQATLSDTYPPTSFATFDPAASKDEHFGRYLRAGRISDRTVLAVIGAIDPWPLLEVNINSDTRRLAGTHYSYLPRVLAVDPSIESAEDVDDFCYDVVDPYNFDATAQYLNSNPIDPCAAHGFLFTQTIDSWRGSPPPSSNGVEELFSVVSVDDYGRPTTLLYSNDVHRADDDYCVDIAYATPTGSGAPVLTAPASRKIYDCSGKGSNAVYSFETFEYDKLPLYSVGAGHVTGHNVERHATDSGAVLASFRDYDASYDAAGNPARLVQTREDGSSRTTTVVYDAFDIAPATVVVAGSGTATLDTVYSLDPYSLDVGETRDANNAMRGTRYDGFGRPTMTTFRQLGGTQMATSSISYLGFTDNTGRRVSVKQFTDPVATNVVATAAGRTSTTYLDEVGRPRVTNLALGPDYGYETLIVGDRTYDSLGRVVFEADPYPASADAKSAYGTTRFFRVDGSPNVFLRGRGRQPLTTTPDASVELYPTVYRHSFDSYEESLSVQRPDSLTNSSPQNGVIRAEIRSAIGRVLFRSTWQNSARLEHEQLVSDRVGHSVALIRFADPAGATLPVQTTTGFDSSGNLYQMQEAGGALQKRYFSNFGELKEVDYIPGGTEPMHSLISKYDALGRLVHAEEKNGGVTDADTVYDYAYDTSHSPTTLVTPTNVLGRLTMATAKTGNQYFGYDNYGRINARVFTDESAAYYIERESFHGDGSRASLELDLPDDAYRAEHVDYGYDSAGRLRSMLYSDGTSTQSLYTATTVDPFGRLRSGTFGETTYAAAYADVGRRLFQSVKISSPLGSRSIAINGFDAVERELSRTEVGQMTTSQTRTYDALGRLSTSVKTVGATSPPTYLANWSYGYDALGNINGLNDYVGSKDAAISYGTTDRDQICRINYNAFGMACNVTHDSFGNVSSEATRTGTRAMTYYNGGAARRIDDSAGSSVTMRYDPFGREQELDLAAGGETRSDRHYGAHISHRYQVSGLLKSNYVKRQFPGPGVLISRRGVGGPWVMSFGEARGVRFSTDDKGTFVQDVDYEPFGEATASGVAAGAPTYSSEQWNGGDALGAVGLVHVGARLYDPAIGRFLSRDPLFAPRTAATTNPYAFAFNDPIGHSDPTGFDPNPPETQDPGSTNYSLTDAYNASVTATPTPPTPPTPPRQVLPNFHVDDPHGDREPVEKTDMVLSWTQGWGVKAGKVEMPNNLGILGAATTAAIWSWSVADNYDKGWRGWARITADTGKAYLSLVGGRWGWAIGEGAELGGRGLGYGLGWLWDVVPQPIGSPEHLVIEYRAEQRHERWLRGQEQQRDEKHAADVRAEELEYSQMMLQRQQLKQEAGMIDDLENERTYGPSCTGEGDASELRDARDGWMIDGP